ncbi:hypothetical protein RQM47_05075 [Rubrivirga sp. S365]|uniref:hypothetical protein n=1 Tax=Rubrivirga sp. S365 TaxID=3076080 RepID=UPI0028CA1E92|nr:hypothetical protein [Rubrivirga sp. S365]MDT7856006.1 hypothetical protein [Rubrivirga sp. S365]
MKKTLLVALAVVGLPLAGCAENEAVEAVTPATDAPVVEEPALIAEPLAADTLVVPEAEMTTEPMTDEALVAPIEGEAPAQDGTTM